MPRSNINEIDATDDSVASENIASPEKLELASESFVGRWNTLVSTTNWEKGRIIQQWREALIDAGAPAAEYSDEAWSLLVGGVTGQHVGRLRRVYQRFNASRESYAGLYWSHFQAALDWDDAEMWLEGALSSEWSVSQMRNQRWETLGSVAGDQPHADDAVASELDEDFEPAQNTQPEAQRASREEVRDVRDDEVRADGNDDEAENGDEEVDATPTEEIAFVRPFANLAELPDDLADAFESFKLAILRHKASGWTDISRDDLLASLDALKALAVAPSAEAAPF
jgi:hypothetical protein